MRIALLALVVTATSALLSAQATFDAASVKPNRSGFPGGTTDFRPGQFVAVNQTLRFILVAAYDLEEFRIVGAPEWIDKERFDIQARATSAVSRRDAMPMLRALLEERFALKAHIERREQPVYRLLLNRAGAPGLRPASPAACVDRGPQPSRVAPGELPSCGLLPARPDGLSGRSVPLELLATQLSPLVRRTVLNRTGRTGLFDIDLEWEIDEAQRAALARLVPDRPLAPADPDRPDLFGALREQLGLALDSTRAAVDVLVIDAVERPTEN
ncbi:MAG TPA: TIGR03435 family protein [Vicinamibacterales bacterium]|jgi:uncharacterized protein (TIGR03435 family)|nr:TIGR03435 family protein [Vicinamibacterales bacterium]